jgi:hypothetical protein
VIQAARPWSVAQDGWRCFLVWRREFELLHGTVHPRLGASTRWMLRREDDCERTGRVLVAGADSCSSRIVGVAVDMMVRWRSSVNTHTYMHTHALLLHSLTTALALSKQ